MTLIDSLWTRSLYFSPASESETSWCRGRKEQGGGAIHWPLICKLENGCVPALSLQFSLHWGKVLFHSCHFRSFIGWGQPRLTVPSPHQHSYQWKWRQHCLQLGGWSGGGGGVSRGSVRVYTIKLRWPWSWKHSLKCTLAPVLLP